MQHGGGWVQADEVAIDLPDAENRPAAAINRERAFCCAVNPTLQSERY
jgi:hypothetical protein